MGPPHTTGRESGRGGPTDGRKKRDETDRQNDAKSTETLSECPDSSVFRNTGLLKKAPSGAVHRSGNPRKAEKKVVSRAKKTDFGRKKAFSAALRERTQGALRQTTLRTTAKSRPQHHGNGCSGRLFPSRWKAVPAPSALTERRRSAPRADARRRPVRRSAHCGRQEVSKQACRLTFCPSRNGE